MKLDKYFQPVNSPIATREGVTSFFDFDSQNEANTVGLRNIRNFNFSSGTGGTITLGGTANGNGQLLIKNAAGSVIVEGNSDGLTVYGGNLVVQNESNTTIIDTEGIVSTANFTVDSVVDVTTRTTASTTPTDVPGSTLDSFVLSRTTKAVVYVTTFGYNIAWLQDADVMQVQCVDSVDGTIVNFPTTIEAQLTQVGGAGPPYEAFGYNIDGQFKSAAIVTSLSAGTHVLKLQFYANNSGTATLASYQLGYVLFGS